MSIDATFLTEENSLGWQEAERLALGGPSESTARAVGAVGIRLGGGKRWRIDLLECMGQACFQDVRSVGKLVYIGFGQQVAVFSATTGGLTSHQLDGYFGHLFTAADVESPELGSAVLVASASELLHFDEAGRLSWKAAELAVDGVIVTQVQDCKIFGVAEWDPPGGWKPFQLDLDSGRPCASGESSSEG